MERKPDASSVDASKDHPDFQIPWVQELLSHPRTEKVPELKPHWDDTIVNNNMFNLTLSHPTGMKARTLIRRPCHEPDSVSKMEDCFIISIGPGIDGASGRAHGGFTSIVLDHLLGNCAHREANCHYPPATATLMVDFKAPVGTPGVVLARAWLTSLEGRKIWLKGTMEDGKGKVFARAKGLFINPRPGDKAAL